jgi:Zn-dependent M16 (insulinase) family peptidase
VLSQQVNNFGLNLIFGLTPTWNHVQDPLRPLHINALLKKFREDLKHPNFLTDKVFVYMCMKLGAKSYDFRFYNYNASVVEG